MSSREHRTSRSWAQTILRSLHALLGLALLLAAGWTLATRWDVLSAAHPAHLALIAVVIVIGMLHLIVSGSRRPRDRPTRIGAHLARLLGVLLSIALLAATVWLRPFPADPAPAPVAGVAVDEGDGTITLAPADGSTTTGLVFWPGARVDPRAYIPLLERVAAEGHTVVIVEEPLQLAMLAPEAHRRSMADHPEVTSWAVGGHSLGGVVASAAADDGDVDALVLWASYPAGSLADRDGLSLTSISGTRDGLSTPEDIAASRAELPASARFIVIDGAVHAHFGDYGAQPGDGTASITRDEAQEQIVRATDEALDAVG